MKATTRYNIVSINDRTGDEVLSTHRTLKAAEKAFEVAKAYAKEDEGYTTDLRLVAVTIFKKARVHGKTLTV